MAVEQHADQSTVMAGHKLMVSYYTQSWQVDKHPAGQPTVDNHGMYQTERADL